MKKIKGKKKIRIGRIILTMIVVFLIIVAATKLYNINSIDSKLKRLHYSTSSIKEIKRLKHG